MRLNTPHTTSGCQERQSWRSPSHPPACQSWRGSSELPHESPGNTGCISYRKPVRRGTENISWLPLPNLIEVGHLDALHDGERAGVDEVVGPVALAEHAIPVHQHLGVDHGSQLVTGLAQGPVFLRQEVIANPDTSGIQLRNIMKGDGPTPRIFLTGLLLARDSRGDGHSNSGQL